MIQINGKACNALFLRIAAAGHYIAYVDGVFETSDDAAVQGIIDAFSVADAIAARSAEVVAVATEKRNAVIAGLSPGEMSSWPIKLAEAQKYTASKLPADAPILSQEAAARGATLDSVVARVWTNGANFAAVEAQIAGVSGKHRDALAALTDFGAVAAYDYSTGWPPV